MIVDSIDHLYRYAVPKAEAILNFIASHDCANLVDGEIQIEGRDLFVRVMSYIPAPKNENRFEIHRIYADVQYIVEGIERMFTAGMNDLTSCSEYDAKGDSHFFKASQPSSDLVVCAGEFAVFYPYQAHCPSCCYEGHNGVVKKLVFKVKIN